MSTILRNVRSALTIVKTCLHWAAKHGNENIIKLIAGSYKADVNSRTYLQNVVMNDFVIIAWRLQTLRKRVKFKLNRNCHIKTEFLRGDVTPTSMRIGKRILINNVQKNPIKIGNIQIK
ncbi:CLUMA_CG013574, isoform A [Clunio marinus]|uniref:CLUMA_CG013574, isoform A n=1 Tax=Clunio marinus TaxID=568069 RepID=A0A1J1IJ85_9DIPT|nr:CLUMA_CG013574, isoform A [Clunio marinus]